MSNPQVNESISCFDVNVFHFNERKTPNPKYKEIKSSIMTSGIKEPLHIVKHPKSSDWVLSQGGQTRLQVCRELFEETGDLIFKYPPTIIGNYTSDLDLCFGHMIENNLRGDTTFVEKSNALLNVFSLVTEREGSEPTQEKLAEIMETNGMPIRRQSITAMFYTGSILLPGITNSHFINNLSRKTVDGIRSLRQKVVNDGDSTEFDEELIAFINKHEANITNHAIRTHFLSDTIPRAVEVNMSFASKLAASVGLNDVVLADDQSESGYLIKLPENIEGPDQAVMVCALVSLSGVFTQDFRSDLAEKMGLSEVTEINEPSLFMKKMLDYLELSDVDLLGSFFRMSCNLDDQNFEAIIGLFTGVRISNNNRVCKGDN